MLASSDHGTKSCHQDIPADEDDVTLYPFDSLTDVLSNIEAVLKKQEKSLTCDKIKQGGAAIGSIVQSVDTARDMLESLKQLCWSVRRREMSLDFRLDEIVDYKRHIKEDVGVLNNSVDSLGDQLLGVETKLCHAQMTEDEVEAEAGELRLEIAQLEITNKMLGRVNGKITKQIELNGVNSRLVDSLKAETGALETQVIVLQDENHSLRDEYLNRVDYSDVIRENDDASVSTDTLSAGSHGSSTADSGFPSS